GVEPGVAQRVLRPPARATQRRRRRGDEAFAHGVVAGARCSPNPGDAVLLFLGRSVGHGRGGARDDVARARQESAVARRGPVLHPSHAAFSTIQEHSASNAMPLYWAISGTSEVGVMPGCVLTSST